MSNKKTLSENAVEVVDELRGATTEMLMTAKNAIKSVASDVWHAMKMKVIGDAVAIIVFTACVVASIRIYSSNQLVMAILIPVCGVIVGSAIKRIIASDYFTLLEILDLAKRDKG